MITITMDTSATRKMLLAASKQARFAAAKTLTSMAKSGQVQIKPVLSALDASPYTKNSTFVKPATPSDLVAIVGIKDTKPASGTAPAVILREHFTAGRRGMKPYEKALSALGVLPSGWRAVTGQSISKDAYGNPTRKAIAEMLGALRTGLRIHSKSTRKKASTIVGYFVILPGAASHLKPGVYRRTNNRAISPMLIYVPAATYRQRMDLARLAKSIASEFSSRFEREYAAALRTAR